MVDSKKASNDNKTKEDYQKLVSFIKRVQLNQHDTAASQKKKECVKDLVPKVQAAREKCQIELPDGRKAELDVLEGTVGPKSIDGRGFFEKTGLYTYDPGFTSTASCVSSITYIDGDLGQLWYRGYAID